MGLYEDIEARKLRNENYEQQQKAQATAAMINAVNDPAYQAPPTLLDRVMELEKKVSVQGAMEDRIAALERIVGVRSIKSVR
jgi:hypothetical protein